MPANSLTAARFLAVFGAVGAGLAAMLVLSIWLLDPFGASPLRLPIARPIMDINQRYMYPQIARGGAYDSVVIGTSTSRLLDPEVLAARFGGRFANLALNAGTAWEQGELLTLFLRHQPAPRMVILGLDFQWCDPHAERDRITDRGFPAWMYDDNPWNNLLPMVSSKTLEITGRLILFHLGQMPERIRRDGYEVFTPPEHSYDLARARWHLWRAHPAGRVVPVEPPVHLSESERAALFFPALAWLDRHLGALPVGTRRLLAFMPIHVSAQPAPGSRDDAITNACKARIAAIGRRHGATVVDFAIPSPITAEDSHYWDPLHYRLPIAARIVDGLVAAAAGVAAPAGGDYVLH